MTAIEFYSSFEKLNSSLNSFAYNLTKNQEEAKDLYQETAYRAITNRDKFNPGTNFKAWTFTIMKNIFINNYRKNQKKNVITDTSDNQYLLNSTKKVEHNGSEVNFLAADIEKAMQEVSTDFTEPFMMYFNGFKYQEIAEQLNLPLGTVKSRIFFARKELQNKLKGMGISNSGFDK